MNARKLKNEGCDRMMSGQARSWVVLTMNG